MRNRTLMESVLLQVNLAEEFDILQIVGEGWFGKILLTEHRATDTEMVLKALPKPYTALRDFYREFHYGLHLAAHRNVITTYDVAFETAGFYVFSQEYAPLGDLTSNVSETGIGELHSKRVARQVRLSNPRYTESAFLFICPEIRLSGKQFLLRTLPIQFAIVQRLVLNTDLSIFQSLVICHSACKFIFSISHLSPAPHLNDSRVFSFI